MPRAARPAPPARPCDRRRAAVRSANCWPCSCPLPAITTHVARPRQRDGALDRGAAVGLGVHRDAVHDLGDDRVGVLAARVVGRDDGEVGQPPRHPPHLRALAAVAVAAAAEHADQPPGGDLAGGREHVLEPVGRVRVVDEHGERLAGVDRLEPARDALHRGDAGPDGRVRQLEQLGQRHGAEHVLDVEAAAQAHVERQRAARRRRDQGDRPARADLDRVRAHVGIGIAARAHR